MRKRSVSYGFENLSPAIFKTTPPMIGADRSALYPACVISRAEITPPLPNTTVYVTSRRARKDASGPASYAIIPCKFTLEETHKWLSA